MPEQKEIISKTVFPILEGVSGKKRFSDQAALASSLLDRFGSLTRVFGASIFELERVDGMNRSTATTIHACHVPTERVLREKVTNRCVISSWAALQAYARVSMAGAAREQFRVFFLDKKNALIADEVMAEGTVDHAPVYPREIVRRAQPQAN